MVTDIHALISGFPQLGNISSLVAEEHLASTDRFTKAGVVPFIRGQARLYYFMKPSSKIPGLGDPPFQICKGTRMQLVPNVGWRDIRESKDRAEVKETLVQTALREGIEELGIKLDNIARLLDMGPYGFSSATTGKSKEMWLFAAEIKNKDAFLASYEIATSTAERAWLGVGEFSVVGREDHRYTLKDIDSKLAMYYKE